MFFTAKGVKASRHAHGIELKAVMASIFVQTLSAATVKGSREGSVLR